MAVRWEYVVIVIGTLIGRAATIRTAPLQLILLARGIPNGNLREDLLISYLIYRDCLSANKTLGEYDESYAHTIIPELAFL